MIPQQFQQPKPPSKSNTLKDVGWPVILVIATVLGSIIAAIILGTTHIIDFNWLLLIWGCIMLGITVLFALYSIRTRQKLQEQYNKDIANIKSDVLTFKNDYRRMREEETHYWNEWAVSFSQANAKEQAERFEEVRKECKEAIGDVNTQLTSAIQNNQTLWTQWTASHANAHHWEKQSNKVQLKALEERLTDKQLSESGN